ncbi:MAG: hypothetical protein LQ352_004214 [Teloschistes flavicans]|nr:MAG: hypothetical protein LQ352_004214 [Teloschistes flavicans]
MAPPSTSIEHLLVPLKTLNGLLEHFQTSLSTTSDLKSGDEPPNALSVLHDSSSLLRAQITKLSLLLLNKPFTPSAIVSVIISINGEILPGLMAADELCQSPSYSHILHKEIRTQLQDLVEGLVGLVCQVPKDESGMRSLDAKREGILKSTGQVWQTCDRLIKVAGMGIVGLAVENAEAYHALVKDAVDELEEWDPDDEDIDPFGGSSDSGSNSDGTASHPPKEPVLKVTKGEIPNRDTGEIERVALDSLQITDMHVVKVATLKTLKLIRMLYPALMKRRISKFLPFARISSISSRPPVAQIEILDQLMQHLRQFSEETDEIAAAVYGRDSAEVERKIQNLKALAERSIGAVKNDWANKEDEFTVWSTQWIQRVNESMVGPRS